MPATVEFLSTADAAEQLGARAWQVERLYERGLLPEPPRVGRCRVLTERDLPTIERALRRAGYLE